MPGSFTRIKGAALIAASLSSCIRIGRFITVPLPPNSQILLHTKTFPARYKNVTKEIVEIGLVKVVQIKLKQLAELGRV